MPEPPQSLQVLLRRLCWQMPMKEVQERVRMGPGSTAVLGACNTGRGEIRAEGVIGLVRAFLFACVAAIVVSLWNVSAASRNAAARVTHMCAE